MERVDGGGGGGLLYTLGVFWELFSLFIYSHQYMLCVLMFFLLRLPVSVRLFKVKF